METRIFIGEQAPAGIEITRRRAARCIARTADGYLMVHTNRGDYKFPGGGVEPGETDEETVIREVLEETGFQIAHVGRLLVTAIQSNVDYKDPTKFFIMESAYYECLLGPSEPFAQQLEEYELGQQFKPVFVTLNEALARNEAIVTANPWVEREIRVLKELIALYP